jgi:hypothetical protein
MAQRASLRDLTSLTVEKRRSNRTVYVASERRAGSLEAGWMAQSAVVVDYRELEVGRRRANRRVLTVGG